MALQNNGFGMAADEFCFGQHSGRGYSQERFLRELCEFVQRNKAIQRLFADGDTDTVGSDFVGCPFCASHPFVGSAAGYWIECSEKDCLKARKASKEESSPCKCVFASCVPEEIYRNYFYGSRHCTYFVKEDDIGPIFLTIKQEFLHSKDFVRVMVRSSCQIIHGILPVTSICTGQYSQEKVVQFLTNQIGLVSAWRLVTLPSASSALLKMDKAFDKSTYKIGVLYVKEGQQTEEDILSNSSHSEAFEQFLHLLGDRVQLLGFTGFRAGLDSNNDLTGTHSVYTKFGKNEIMFHVSTLLPLEKRDLQKLQRKRHIGNDMVCIVFLEAVHTKFTPDCIKSNFLHTFIIIQVDPSGPSNKYTVACVSRNQVPSYDPPLHKECVFQKGCLFRDWLLHKVISGEQACHAAPKFAKLHSRTQCQIMEDIITATEQSVNSESSLTCRDQGRWLHQTANSSFHELTDRESAADLMTRDFTAASPGSGAKNPDIASFIVGKEHKKRFVGVRSTMASQSRVFQEMFTEESAHSTAEPPSPPAAPPSAGVKKRPASWSRPGPKFPSKARSGKFRLEKMKIYKSESDSADGPVILASVSDLAHGGCGRIPQHEYVLEGFESDVFEALLEYLHFGSCEMASSVVPHLLRAAQHFDVPELCQRCLIEYGDMALSSSDLVPHGQQNGGSQGEAGTKDTSL